VVPSTHSWAARRTATLAELQKEPMIVRERGSGSRGIALISKRAVEDECRAGLLACVKIKDLRVSRAFHLVTHRDRTRSPLAQAFVEFVESQPPPRAS
jgi:DNA-binding transcriptional LysR family regulator